MIASASSSGGYMDQNAQAMKAPRIRRRCHLRGQPSITDGAISQSALDQFTPSMGAGLAVVDNMLQQLRAGALYQNLWQLPQYQFQRPDGKLARLWGAVVDMGVTNRMRPQYLALQMVNQALGGTMYQTSHSGADPARNQAALNGVQLNGAHYLQSFVFTKGNTTSLIVLNLHPTQALPVTFSGNVPSGSVQMSHLTSANITEQRPFVNNVISTNSTLTGSSPGRTRVASSRLSDLYLPGPPAQAPGMNNILKLMPSLSVLLTATTWWRHFLARLAIAPKNHGCRASAPLPTRTSAQFGFGHPSIHGYDPFSPGSAPARALSRTRPDLVIPCDDRAVRQLHQTWHEYPEFRSLIEHSMGEPSQSASVRSPSRSDGPARELGNQSRHRPSDTSAKTMPWPGSARRRQCGRQTRGYLGRYGVRIVTFPPLKKPVPRSSISKPPPSRVPMERRLAGSGSARLLRGFPDEPAESPSSSGSRGRNSNAPMVPSRRRIAPAWSPWERWLRRAKRERRPSFASLTTLFIKGLATLIAALPRSIRIPRPLTSFWSSPWPTLS